MNFISDKMFLDDELYQKVKSFEIKSAEDFQILVNELYKICDTHYKNKIITMVGSSYKEIRYELDKTFKMWDFFIDKLDKENWWLVDILKTYSYRKIFMSNEKLREIYNRGK
jgi:hypothetical protein